MSGFRQAQSGATEGRLALALPFALGLTVLAGLAMRRDPSSSRPTPIDTGARGGYATSGACRSCHPDEYRTWHDSYHRTMTGGSDTAIPSFDRLDVTYRDARFEGFERDGRAWVRLPDPDGLSQRGPDRAAWSSLARVERPIEMTTGSHHYQAYWVRGARGNELWQLPFVYLLDDERFVPRHLAFLQPPDDPEYVPRWNSNCVQCHAVAGEPRHDPESDRFDTRAVELGIACEACHGPAATHVSKHQSPFERYRARADARADSSIVNPARLDAERASQVCGQCHSFFLPSDPDHWWQRGFADRYRPGDDLSTSRRVLVYERDRHSELLSTPLESIFHPDGTVRVGGRELNGLTRSACFERGRGARQLSCLTCHRLHGGSRDDQLRVDLGTDAICADCHGEVAREPEAHAHHPAGSAGSSCVDCHMPPTTYALFKGIRSHRITAPDARASRDLDSPNACNLCHVDRGLAWTAGWLARWYGMPPAKTWPRPPEASAPTRSAAQEAQVHDARLGWSAVGTALLAGDAAQRVIAANALGLPSATGDVAFKSQLLLEALSDPYAAVRRVAQRALSRQPGMPSFEFDFAREPASAGRQLARAERAVRSISSPAIDPVRVRRLLEARNLRPIRISE